jgi:hypothetical protein
MPTKIDVPTEYQEACCFVDWLELMKQQGKILDYCHIANESYGGTRADMLRGMKLKRQGRKKGVFDYQIFVNKKAEDYLDKSPTIICAKIICVELKKIKGGKVSEEQLWWRALYQHCGIPAKICHGAEEAIEFVKKFI